MKRELFNWPHEVEPPVLYANRQWAVTRYGLECLTTHYPIEASRLGERRPFSKGQHLDWPLHLAEKEWLDYAEFADAFRRAVVIHRKRIRRTERFTADQLERSLAEGVRLHERFFGWVAA
jgi:hypothetical protein